jgi:hypothetical protein
VQPWTAMVARHRSEHRPEPGRGEAGNDPEIARWTNKDPIGFAGQQGNVYLYVGGDGVNRRDIEGLWGIYVIYPGSVDVGIGDLGVDMSAGIYIGTEGIFQWKSLNSAKGFYSSAGVGHGGIGLHWSSLDAFANNTGHRLQAEFLEGFEVTVNRASGHGFLGFVGIDVEIGSGVGEGYAVLEGDTHMTPFFDVETKMCPANPAYGAEGQGSM